MTKWDRIYNRFMDLTMALLMVIFITVVLFLFFMLFVEAVNAAPVETEDNGIANGVFVADYNNLPDDSNANYEIDLSTKTPDDKSGVEDFMDSVKNFNPLANAAKDNAMEILNVLVNVILVWNMMMTNLMISTLHLGFATELVNAWVEIMTNIVQRMAGITGLSVQGGLFGSLLGFAVVASALVAVYQMSVKGGNLAGMQTLSKTVAALTLSFILFYQFGPIMKGMNEISNEISAAMLTGGSNVITEDNRSEDELLADVSSNLWNEFIGRPYMVLQYGTDDIERIGEERVNELLALPPGEERQKYVDEIEVEERENEVMTHAGIYDRLGFSILYSMVNMAVSLPIYALALALIVFQLAFLMIAFFAPFVMIQSTFPGQFPVLKRYAALLIYPLFLKIVATVATFCVFTLGFGFYSLPVIESLGVAQYFISAILIVAMGLGFLVFRKPLMNVFKAGSRGPFGALQGEIRGLSQSLHGVSSKLTNTTKSAISITSAAATGGTSAAVTTAAAAVIAKTQQEKPAEPAAPAPAQPMADVPPPETDNLPFSDSMDVMPAATVIKEEEPQHMEDQAPQETNVLPLADIEEPQLRVKDKGTEGEEHERKTDSAD